MRWPKWISAQALDHWAKAPQAKQDLAELARRLVLTNVPREHLLKIDFPSEGEFQRPGYDGTTVTDKSAPYVPQGICFWELSCRANPAGKAQDDYELRIAENDASRQKGSVDNIKEATFIFVTPRKWTNADKWAKDRANEKHFRAVLAYDSNRLEHWIYEFPAVGLWLAEKIHGERKGVRSVIEYWANLQGTLRQKLPPEVFLVNREQTTARFADWLKKAPEQLAVKAPSPAELVDVFCAWLHTLPQADGDSVSSRTIIVEDRETWRNLCTSTQPLVLVATPELEPDNDIFAEAVIHGHHILRNAAFSSPRNAGSLQMERMRRFDLEEALRKAGNVG